MWNAKSREETALHYFELASKGLQLSCFFLMRGVHPLPAGTHFLYALLKIGLTFLKTYEGNKVSGVLLRKPQFFTGLPY